MNAIVLFLLKSLLVSGALTTWYWLGLRNRRMHQYNRFFLLFTLYASIQVPLLHFNWFTMHTAISVTPSPALYILQAVNSPGGIEVTDSIPVVHSTVDWAMLAAAIFTVVSLTLLAILLVRTLWILRMRKQFSQTTVDGVKIYHTNLSMAPFSFFNSLFWRDDIALDSDNGRLILRHELTHIRQRHTWDKLASQLFTCLCWFNPFYWIIRQELGMLHEFIADEVAVDNRNTDLFARMLLQQHDKGRYLIPAHRFFSSPIKRRLVMLQKTTTKYAWLRYMLVMPVLAGSMMIFSFNFRGPHPIKAVKAERKILLVLDAGHGGTDIGGSNGSLYEKDICLKVTNRMKELAPAYNIEVFLTRPDNNYITLADRVKLSNTQKPDAFISIHMDALASQKNGTDSFSVMVAKDDAGVIKEETKKLGYAIIGELLNTGTAQSGRSMERLSRIYVLRKNTAPAVCIELGNIYCKKHMDKFSDPDYLDEVCSAILKGVVLANKN